MQTDPELATNPNARNLDLVEAALRGFKKHPDHQSLFEAAAAELLQSRGNE